MRICLSVPAAHSAHVPVLWDGLDAARCPPRQCLTPFAHQSTGREQEEKAPGSRKRDIAYLLCYEQNRHDLEKNYCHVLPIKNRVE